MKYHPSIKWDYDYHKERLASLVKMSPILWRITKIRGNKYGSTVAVGSNDNYITIHRATKEEYHRIIEALNLDMGKKEAGSSRITARFKGEGIDIVFSWDLPETCNVIYEEEIIPEDEIIRVRKVIKEVICEKPLMQSVFPDWVEEENGTGIIEEKR